MKLVLINEDGQMGRKDYTREAAVEDIEEKQSDLHYRTPQRIISRTAEETGVGLKTRRLYTKYLAQPDSFLP